MFLLRSMYFVCCEHSWLQFWAPLTWPEFMSGDSLKLEDQLYLPWTWVLEALWRNFWRPFAMSRRLTQELWFCLGILSSEFGSSVGCLSLASPDSVTALTINERNRSMVVFKRWERGLNTSQQLISDWESVYWNTAWYGCHHISGDTDWTNFFFLVVVIPLQQGFLLHFSTWPLALEILESLAWEFRRLDSALSFPAFWPESKLPPLSSTSSLCGWLINMERICITKLGIWQPFSASHWFKDVFYLECHQRNPDLFCGAFKTHLEAAK